MNSKLWIRKALSMCTMVAVVATYSMVALANSERIAGELTVTGKSINGETSVVTVNGEAAESGRSIFSSSTIATPEGAGAVINLGKVGKIELDPNTTLSLSFDSNTANGELTAGRVTVLGTSNGIDFKTADGKTVRLNAGESVMASGGKAQADDDDKPAWWVFALIFVAAGAVVVAAVVTDNNDTTLGGNTTVSSPSR